MRRLPALLLGAVLALTGCSGLQGTGDPNFTTGDGSIVQVAVDDREAPIEISGTSLQGEPVDLADYRGEVVVLNYWASWCGPCAAEAPVLAEASEQVDARFVGAQLRYDSRGSAIGFERRFGITYPTIEDSGTSMLELGSYVPRANPSTIILDRQGRVAALISGAITSAVTLDDLVGEIGAEDG